MESEETTCMLQPAIGCCTVLAVHMRESWRTRPCNNRVHLLDLLKRASLCSTNFRSVSTELPSEDPLSERWHMVGKLDKAMYGIEMLLLHGRRSWRRR